MYPCISVIFGSIHEIKKPVLEDLGHGYTKIDADRLRKWLLIMTIFICPRFNSRVLYFLVRSNYLVFGGPGLPRNLQTPLQFCSYSRSTCCSSAEDARLQARSRALKISDKGCASLLKSILCSICDPFSAELYETESGLRNVPVLCNSISSVESNLSNETISHGFCLELWDRCHNVSIWDSPFNPSMQGRAKLVSDTNPSKLIDHWESSTRFCEAFGGSSRTGMCFSGRPVSFDKVKTPQPPEGLCLEKLDNGGYINMVPHPDGSNQVFLANQKGQIWLATVPDEGSIKVLEIDVSEPFLDVGDHVAYEPEFGLMGMAFHPNFSQNGRFFLSFNCDKLKHPGCSGRCSCNTDVNCDPSKFAADHGVHPCQYHSVIAEFTVNGTASRLPSANPSEMRRILTMGLPSSGDHAGQILFGPADGYLYFMMGDGSPRDDPYNFAQSKKSLLGKIMRLDIDHIPSAKAIREKGLWGSYSIPRDNPYVDDKELAPEIWAMGFRNPWRCSFDSARPSYFLCGDCGQDQYEEIDKVTRGGNYGWRVYEGPFLFHPDSSPGGNTSASSIKPIFPVMGYDHSETDNHVGSASITGGYFYRSTTDPCLYGSYLYMDLYAGAVWAGIEDPENSGNFTIAKLSYRCAHDSPIQCNYVDGSSLPAIGYIFSFAEDNKKDVYILTSTGVYRIARPSRCSYTCSKQTTAAMVTSGPQSSSSPRILARRFINFTSPFLSLFACILHGIVMPQ